MPEKTVTADIRLSQINTTGGTQSRVALSDSVVAAYAELMKEGGAMPPIVVFHDGSTYWLADGFHRVMAANRAGLEWLASEVYVGTKREAILYSVGANSTHGLPRTNEDKRRAVLMLLKDEEWSQWSDREIGRRCAVTHNLVGGLRQSILGTEPSMKSDRTFKHHKTGTEAKMKTENIGHGLREGCESAETRRAQIESLAAQGKRATQIADEIGIGESRVRKLASAHNIELPDQVLGKAHKINNRRVIETTVLNLDASAHSLQTVGYSFEGITQEEAADWAESLAESLKIYRTFHKKLQEVANGK